MRNGLSLIKRVEYDHTDVLPRCHMSERNEAYTNFDDFIKSLTFTDFAHYPNVKPLKIELAERHNVEPDNVFIASGSDRVISIVFNALLNPNEVVATSHYFFKMYDVYARQVGATLLNNLDVKDPKLVILANPCSTLGIGAHIQNWTCPVLIDNAYLDFGGTNFDVKTLIRENFIFTYSFSKGWGAAGIRVGYCIASKENIAKFMKFRDMFEITGPSIKFAKWLLDNEPSIIQWRNEMMREKQSLKDIALIPQYGNWVYLNQDKFDFDGAVKRDILIPEIAEFHLLKVSMVNNIRSYIRHKIV